MNTTDIPFVKLAGIKQEVDSLSLEFNDNIQNHINTIHAGAQFTLAETQSGLYLQKSFPELDGKVIPILRDAEVKYKNPAQKKIVAEANCDAFTIEKFQEQFDKKGRGSIKVNVTVKDINDVITCQAVFNWFVQSI